MLSLLEPIVIKRLLNIPLYMLLLPTPIKLQLHLTRARLHLLLPNESLINSDTHLDVIVRNKTQVHEWCFSSHCYRGLGRF